LNPGISISYRAGDQPNNAFSLNVLNPGEIAATAGTSGVVYGVSDEIRYDPESRVNTFAHVNHEKDNPRLGVLLCINGTGILNAWLKRMVGENLSYEQMNEEASKVAIGSNGISILPFGNGAERVLNNSLRFVAFATLLSALVVMLFQEDLVVFLFSKEYLDSAPALSLLMVGISIFLVGNILIIFIFKWNTVFHLYEIIYIKEKEIQPF